MDDLFLVGFSAALYNPFNSNDSNMPLPMKALSFFIEKLVFKAHIVYINIKFALENK